MKNLNRELWDNIDSKIMVEFKNPNEVNDRSIYFRPYDFKRKD